MARPVPFDVLVIGSGASGLAAAVSASRAGARVGLATKGALQSCNSAKAQGGIQAAFGEDDSPEQHAEDVWTSSHETADRRLVEILTSEAPSAIHWLEEFGVEFTSENGGYRLARCGGATRRRLLQVGDRTGHAITKALREAAHANGVETFPKSPLRELERIPGGWRARCGTHMLDASTVVLAAGGRWSRRVPRHHPDTRTRRGRFASVHAAPLPRWWDRSAVRADPHVSRSALPKRRTRHRREFGDHGRRSLRVRGDRGRNARTQSHDGKFVARVHGLRSARGSCGEGKGTLVITTDLEGMVEDAAAHLYVWALK